MRVSCLQDNLHEGIRTVTRAVPKRSTLPVLSNILIGTDKGMLKLAATDLQIGITTWIEATIEEEGETTLPAKLFADLVKQSPPERISLELNGTSQEMKYGCASVASVIKGIDAEEFPIIPSPSQDDVIRIPASILHELIDHVAFSAATDESRPILTGVLMSFKDDQVSMAAADGFRLSMQSAPLEKAVSENVQAIIPANALTELGKVLNNSDETVEITITENQNQILFHTDKVELVTQLIEGNFPDVQRLVPASYETRTVVDRAPFMKAVARADIFARDAAHIIRIQMQQNDNGLPGTLTLSAESTELGENVEELIATVEGEGMEIAFNAKYLLELLKVIDSPQVVIETSNSNAPGVIRPIGVEGFTHVIMPMHITTG